MIRKIANIAGRGMTGFPQPAVDLREYPCVDGFISVPGSLAQVFVRFRHFLSIIQAIDNLQEPPGGIFVLRNREVREFPVEVGSLEGAGKTPGIFHVPAPVQGEGEKIFRFPEGVYEHIPGFVSEMFRRRPALGIEGAPMTAQMAEYMGIDEVEGVLVTAVLEGTPASSAGIKAGDLITAVNGRKVKEPMDLRNSLKKGAQKLDLVRNRKKMSLEVNIVAPEEKDSSRETFRM